MRALWELTKPRITLLVVLSSAVGFCLGAGPLVDGSKLAWTLLGVALVSAATGCLNQWMEREEDALMARTRTRPLPAGQITPNGAAAWGVVCALAGHAVLAVWVNLSATGWAAFTFFSYLLVYTPLKKKTPWAMWVGAIPGAMPPLIGWAAARGGTDSGAWVLYSIQFLWQIPHFVALAWMYGADYSRAGFRVGVPDERGRSVQILWTISLLLPVSLLPNFLGWAGSVYWITALLAGVLFLSAGIYSFMRPCVLRARRVFWASLIYWPVLLTGLFVDWTLY